MIGRACGVFSRQALDELAPANDLSPGPIDVRRKDFIGVRYHDASGGAKPIFGFSAIIFGIHGATIRRHSFFASVTRRMRSFASQSRNPHLYARSVESASAEGTAQPAAAGTARSKRLAGS